jgi:hypothetical protein
VENHRVKSSWKTLSPAEATGGYRAPGVIPSQITTIRTHTWKGIPAREHLQGDFPEWREYSGNVDERKADA